jgi:glucose-6-phosphate 1-epimerase
MSGPTFMSFRVPMKPSIEEIEFHGIAALRLNGPRGASAVVSKLGAQVLSWITPDGRERLFLSDKAVFDGSVAIRGGVPICWPQFAGLGDLPKHGFVRTRTWQVGAQRSGGDYALATLELEDDEATRALWPHAFRLELTVMLEADRLDLELSVTNTGGAEFAFTGALHTYLRVVQVEDVTLEGLYGHDYRDAAKGDAVIRDTGTHIAVEDEMDRVYRRVKRPQLLQAGNLSLAAQSQGFPDVVVWNPWVEKCATMADMPADGWRHMLCVEAVAEQPVVVAAGDEWYGRQTLVAV